MTILTYAIRMTAITFCLGLGTATFAQQERYECTLTKRSTRGPVPEVLTLRVNPAKFTASVVDVYTKQISSKPFPAEYEPLNTRKLAVKWRLVGLDYKGSETRVTGGVVDYKLTLRKPELTVKLTGASREHYSKIHGEGRCVRR